MMKLHKHDYIITQFLEITAKSQKQLMKQIWMLLFKHPFIN